MTSCYSSAIPEVGLRKITISVWNNWLNKLQVSKGENPKMALLCEIVNVSTRQSLQTSIFFLKPFFFFGAEERKRGFSIKINLATVIFISKSILLFTFCFVSWETDCSMPPVDENGMQLHFQKSGLSAITFFFNHIHTVGWLVWVSKYSLVPIRRQVPINCHASRHWKNHNSIKRHT